MDEMDDRAKDNLRSLIDSACQGVMSHLQLRIKDVAKRAYYLGCQDGMELQRNKEEEKTK
jgi:hypothetical protein